MNSAREEFRLGRRERRKAVGGEGDATRRARGGEWMLNDRKNTRRRKVLGTRGGVGWSVVPIRASCRERGGSSRT